ncbi:putative uncharacterized protein [Clostridium sp. CAG:492]|nr:putative uncharacterized protein [Clostridium sp. CAG:492]
MLKKIKIEDIDNVMELWKEEINKSGMPSKNKIILNDYTSVRKKLVENINSTILYTEDGVIEGIISVDNLKNEVWLIIVKSSIQREGIGTILLNNIKRKKTQITTTINSSNEKALLFFYKNGFKKVEEKENEKTKQKDYILDWSKQKNKQITVAYFDEDISSELIEKQDKKDNINYKSINVKQFFKDENNKKIELNNIKTYIQLRKKIEEALKGEEVLLYIDYNNHYSFLDEQIKEIAKIQKVRLNIILCEPFSIENAKKINYIKEIEKVYEDYNIYKVDCSLSEQKNIALNQIFEKRQEMLISKIDEITKKIKSAK